MRNFLPPGSALFLVLVASVAMARERIPSVRSVYVRNSEWETANQLFVTRDVTTVLRFQQSCTEAGTKMLGWEGRFEPVQCAGKRVLVEPIQKLEPEDRFLLVVRLADGTEVPFTVSGSSWKEGEWPDQQVNVFLKPDDPDALRNQLEESKARERELWEQLRVESFTGSSENHTLAALLTQGAVRFTPFVFRKAWIFKNEDSNIQASVLTDGKEKVAVLFRVTNKASSNPWRLMDARLFVLPPGFQPPLFVGEARPFALRTDKKVIPPGETGFVAVVADKSVFDPPRGPSNLTLGIFRHDGMLAAHVTLDRRLFKK
ncbi:DUF2381 family protein [Cystobacter ferrugineus]|uniref:DUF2381 family protein n=1 Tax=Cystobacter ferrugineus TaxID=83449 RepID=A0A1L9AV34_9BACT|nr:DUF2381 family protein [Cystobacter ferrugineus]OJH33869.1 hypothetical protein BON30_46510 [Cystobacter ferrugineus]